MKNDKSLIIASVGLIMLLAILTLFALKQSGISSLADILDPSKGLMLSSILIISFVLGVLHGITPDEHTWPITFSYAIGSYSTKKGMKAGFSFSAGFTLQRAFLTTLGFLGLAGIYKMYNLNGPVDLVVGIVMAIAGIYILDKKVDLHIPFDALFGKTEHHSSRAERLELKEFHLKNVSMKMALTHGLIAGFGFGAYATILTFILAPQVPSLIYAPLPGFFFGIGTMLMQILYGALFASLIKLRKLSEKQATYVGRKTAGRTLYYGGILFAIIGLAIIFFPAIESFAISTGNQIPNLDSIGVETLAVVIVVGVIGLGSVIAGIREILAMGKSSKTNGKKRSGKSNKKRAK